MLCDLQVLVFSTLCCHGHCCCSGTTWLTKVFWGLFIVLSTIVMLNMLIAMMAETYESLRTEAKTRWKLLLAAEVIASERSIMKKVVELYSGKSLIDLRPANHKLKTLTDEYGKKVVTWEMQVEKRIEGDGHTNQTWTAALEADSRVGLGENGNQAQQQALESIHAQLRLLNKEELYDVEHSIQLLKSVKWSCKEVEPLTEIENP